jgi:hypothetical protein
MMDKWEQTSITVTPVIKAKTIRITDQLSDWQSAQKPTRTKINL